MKRIAVLVVLILLVLGLVSCKTNLDTACNGHGHQAGYANGWVKCSDGTWQAAG